MVRGRPKNIDSRKKLKRLYFNARNNKFPHMLKMDKKNNIFAVVKMNKRNSNWNPNNIALFKDSDETNLKDAAKYRKKDTYDTDCKHRFFQNINKWCNEGLVEKITVKKVKESIEIHVFKFLKIPDSWQEKGSGSLDSQHEENKSNEIYFPGEQGKEMSYLNSPMMNILEQGIKMPYFETPTLNTSEQRIKMFYLASPMSNTLAPVLLTNPVENSVFKENVVQLHIPEDAYSESSGNISPTSEKVASDGEEISYLLSPLMTYNMGDVTTNAGINSLQSYDSSKENSENNISPTLEDQAFGMQTFNLNQQNVSNSLMDVTSITNSDFMQPSTNMQDYRDEINPFLGDDNIDLNLWADLGILDDEGKNEFYSNQILSDISNKNIDLKAEVSVGDLPPYLDQLELSDSFDSYNEESVFLRENSSDMVFGAVQNENDPLTYYAL